MSGLKKNKITVGLVNLNINNLFSIYHFLMKLNFNVTIVNINEKIKNFDILVLPGVGSFKAAINILKKQKFDEKIIEYHQKNKFIFAICLGMQLLFEKSEEFGNTNGLGIVEGKVLRFPKKKGLIIPHVGWNKIVNCKKKFYFLNEKSFYFIHSLYCKPKNEDIILSNTVYKNEIFCSSILTTNILATQFHPEKSGKFGIELVQKLKKVI
tara:strand:+ start:324 stop:953 length:630 start_codon:yes stop_codon:yes gene_type:complete